MQNNPSDPYTVTSMNVSLNKQFSPYSGLYNPVSRVVFQQHNSTTSTITHEETATNTKMTLITISRPMQQVVAKITSLLPKHFNLEQQTRKISEPDTTYLKTSETNYLTFNKDEQK